MADVTWSAYALAMFTPEQRAAAVNAVYEPIEEVRPIPPVPPAGYVPLAPGSPTSRVTIGGTSYDPNTPQQLRIIMDAGYRFEGGRWIAPGSVGVAATADQAQASGASRVGLSSVAPAAFIPGASVLGSVVPLAPPVLLPSFVGGRVGMVRIGGGMRPSSGGNPDRIRFGDPRILPVVRMENAGGGGGGGSW